MNIQSKKIRKSSFFQKSLFSHLQKWDFYKSFILACVWSAKKYFKTHHGQIRWTILSNTPLRGQNWVSPIFYIAYATFQFETDKTRGRSSFYLILPRHLQGVHEMVLRFPLAVAQYKMIPQSFFLYQ